MIANQFDDNARTKVTSQSRGYVIRPSFTEYNPVTSLHG